MNGQNPNQNVNNNGTNNGGGLGTSLGPINLGNPGANLGVPPASVNQGPMAAGMPSAPNTPAPAAAPMPNNAPVPNQGQMGTPVAGGMANMAQGAAAPASQATPDISVITPSNAPATSAPSQMTSGAVNLGTVGTDPMENVNVNGFVEANKKQDVGTTPPPKDNKAKMNKPAFIVLIVGLIALVAFGVYKVLNMSNKSNITITLKNPTITLQAGEAISTDVAYYANVEGTQATNCNIENINNIDASKPGTYTYQIVCGSGKDSVKKQGTIVITEAPDVAGPVLALKPLYKIVGESTPVASDFVTSCKDENQDCTNVTINNEADLATSMQTAGTYEIEISATDSKGNTTTAKAPLYVLANSILLRYNCLDNKNDPVDGYNATKSSSDYYVVVRSNEAGPVFGNAARRTNTYVFASEEDYNKVVGNHQPIITFDNTTGLAEYDDANLTLKISIDLPISVLNTEAGGTFPTSAGEVNTYYTTKGYTCNPVVNP